MNPPASPPPLQGVLSVFQLPYHDSEAVDIDTLEKEIHWIFEQGADGIVMAMVSEVLRLSSEERDEVATLACRFAEGRGPVVISVGAESSHVAARHAAHAQHYGATAVMAIPPISVALGDDQLLAYYRRIIAATHLPVIVQDASGYIGQPMSIAMQAQLLDEFGPDRVMFKPEAKPIGPRLSALLKATNQKARVFEGTAGVALPDSYQRGVTGTMPGADVIVPLVAMWDALRRGDQRRVDKIHQPLAALVSMQQSLDAFLAVEKHLLVRQGIFENTIVRGPVGFHLDEQTKRQVDHLFDHLMRAVHDSA